MAGHPAPAAPEWGADAASAGEFRAPGLRFVRRGRLLIVDDEVVFFGVRSVGCSRTNEHEGHGHQPRQRCDRAVTGG